MGVITLPEKQIPAGATKVFDLENLIENANVPNAVTYGGIELEYDTPKGSVITSVQSISQNGDHVFQVPMFDPANMPSSAGGFPWKVDGDYRTLVYIKNETSVTRKYIAHLLYQGGQYSPGVKELKPGETVAIDFRALRDSQTPDSIGRIIPLNVQTGQIGWSSHGRENKVMSGRSEQISLTEGVASTYACANCCPNVVNGVFIDPNSTNAGVGDSFIYTGSQTETNCSNQTMGPYAAESIQYESLDTNIATIDYYGGADAVGVGSTNIQGSVERTIWYIWGDGYCEPFIIDRIYAQSPIDVTNPQPSISEIGVVERNGLKSVNISVTGAGNQDTTVFRLRRTTGTGSATFEDGTTEKSYNGNLSNTELKIKGVTESSAASNYVMEALANQTLHQQSAKTFTVAVISSLVFERINTTGSNPDVAFDNNPGTDGTHTAEEGLRIFPDKNTAMDSTDRAIIRVKAIVLPANVPTLNVYFASFDLDDPSAPGLPVDTTANDGVDNYGQVNNSKSGGFSTATGVSCAGASNGAAPLYISKIACPVSGTETSAHFQTTMQPGDNFTIFASLAEAYRDEIRVNASAGTSLTNSATQTIPISGEGNPSNVRGIRTRMLTVWRRLHIELDTMGEIQGNFTTGTIAVGFTIAPGQTAPILTSTSANLQENEAQNGRIQIGVRSLEVLGNVFSSDVTARNSTSVPISGSAGEQFTLYDDDDFNNNDGSFLIGDSNESIPHLETSVLMQNSDSPSSNVLAQAYIRPVYDLDGNGVSYFAKNIADPGEFQEVRDVFNFENIGTADSSDFWTVYLLNGYQYTVGEDNDPETEVNVTVGIADNGPNPQGAIVFMESIGAKDCAVTGGMILLCDRPSTVAHEVVHLFGPADGEGGLMSGLSNILSPTSLAKIRARVHP